MADDSLHFIDDQHKQLADCLLSADDVSIVIKETSYDHTFIQNSLLDEAHEKIRSLMMQLDQAHDKIRSQVCHSYNYLF